MTDEVIFALEGHAGRIRLNRPRAIHALTHAMCLRMAERLIAWREDPAVELVLVDHAEGRGFCAGGDIRAIAASGAGDGEDARAFFAAEYRLNHLMFTYAKPIVAFMDGVTMGGGVGISQPARYRVATERTIYAMPESGIGLFPDVGGGWYLSRLPGHMGEYLALTGARLDGAECLALELATHYLSSSALDAVKAELVSNPRGADAILERASISAPEPRIIAHQAEIDRLFAGNTLEEIVAALDADPNEWAQQQRATLATKSPQTCKIALKELAESRLLTDFADEMRMEYRIAARICQRHDFLEGVRALIVDKDNAPRWDPATPEGVTDHLIDTIFAPLPPDEEWEPYRL